MNIDQHPYGNPYYLFNTGENDQVYKLLGAQIEAEGVTFRVWAPKAAFVEVIGDFNDWQPGRFRLSLHQETGIWEGRSSSAKAYQKYKYVIYHQDGSFTYKSDPMARYAELRPQTASVIYPQDAFVWTDAEFRRNRPPARANNFPLNIYEVHLGSWKKHYDGRFYTYRELAHALADYVVEMGYNFVELLPILEHPLDASWGYQVTGFFAPTSRFGTPTDFKYFVNHLHEKGIGVILDWVPAHFPKDEFGLYQFDGTATYEPADARLAEQKEWGTCVFDFGRAEVRSFLFSSAEFWLEEYHLDGLRVDAVSTILYRNYASVEYVPNIYGGRESLEGAAFLRELNRRLEAKFPQALFIAEESTTWPHLTDRTEEGGIGFSYKWDMGWMHDTLDYMSLDYIYRPYHHHHITFSMSYGFSERFLLPLSHDEVVHGKKSLIDRMPGDYWRKFACLRALYVYMMGHPGGKLLFMGGEFAQFIEWRFYEELQWFMLQYEAHQQMHDFVKTLNHHYLKTPAFWQVDTNWEGFQWLQADDAARSIFSFYRKDEEGNIAVFVINATPATHPDYRVGVPCRGDYHMLLNSDEQVFGGSGFPLRQRLEYVLREGEVHYREGRTLYTNKVAADGYEHSLRFDLPPLSGLIFYHAKRKNTENR